MKNNILVALAFAIISVTSLFSQKIIKSNGTVSLNSIGAMAQAQSESQGCPCIWTLRYEEHNGVVYVTCIAGGTFCCPGC